MPNYYFHLRYGQQISAADDTLEFETFAAAKQDAERSARDLLVEAIKFGGNNPAPDAFVIADDAGKTLHEMRLVDVLPAPLRR